MSYPLRASALLLATVLLMLAGALLAAPPDEGNMLYLPVVEHQPSPTPTATPFPVTEIANGGFEAGRVGWAEFSSHAYPLIFHQPSNPELPPPPEGEWLAWLGGAREETSVISQQVTVPADRPFLVYRLAIGTQDITCDDDLGAVVFGSQVVDSYLLCEKTITSGWVQRAVDLSAHIGQTAPLELLADIGSDSTSSSMYVDDVRFLAAPPPPPIGAQPAAAPSPALSRPQGRGAPPSQAEAAHLAALRALLWASQQAAP